jgi:transposase
MGAAIKLRDDFDGAVLRDLAKRSRDGGQSRRLITLAEVYDGGRRSETARLSGVGLQIVRDWVLRFNAEGPDGLIDRKSAGPRRKLTNEQRTALVRMVERGPIPAIHGVVRWRRSDLAQWLWEEYGVSLDVTTVGRELRRLGFAKLSARPRHYAQNEFAVEAFKKTSPTS